MNARIGVGTAATSREASADWPFRKPMWPVIMVAIVTEGVMWPPLQLAGNITQSDSRAAQIAAALT